MSVIPGMMAPEFQGMSIQSGTFSDCSLSTLLSKKSRALLFFFPLDFGHIAASELLEIEKIRKKLLGLGCRVAAISRDSVLSHEQFSLLSPECGGVYGINFPLIEDVSLEISRDYGMLNESYGHSFRGYFIVDPVGIVKGRVCCDLPVGIYAGDILEHVKKLVEAENKGLEDTAVLENNVDTTGSMLSSFQTSEGYYETNVLCPQDSPLYHSGVMQSPINIMLSVVEESDKLHQVTFKYTAPWETQANSEPQPTTVKNNGRGWEIPISGKWQAMVHGGPLDGQEYRLAEIQAHWGWSEHSVDGAFADGELHFVHYNNKYESEHVAHTHADGYCIVAVFMAKNSRYHNRELEEIAHVLPVIKERGRETTTSLPISLEGLLPISRSYFAYKGSLTIPDYRENVQWIVMEDPISLSPKALAAMKDLSFGSEHDKKITYNTRPQAPLHDRQVTRVCL